MNVEFPQIDQIMHASLDEKSYTQREYVHLMNQCSNFINITFQEYLDRISREYNRESIADILAMVNLVLKEEAEACPDNRIIYDDFVKNASIVSQALKKIFRSPSRKLIKIDKNVPANKVTQFDSKTMTWLSRRPGVTIEEKISPRNVIPTKITYFTADTVENRHTLYLFDILYDYLYEKIYPNGEEMPCGNCPNRDKKCNELYDKLKTILFLKQKVRTTDLKEVPKQKQLRQNNKLLSDKEYKQIWDAVRDVDYYEQNCKNVWEHLEERYQFIAFLIVCAKISSLEEVYVYDCYSRPVDHEGQITLVNHEGINIVKFYNSAKDDEIIAVLHDNEIDVRIYRFYTENSISYKKEEIYHTGFDVSDFFSEIDIIGEKERHLEQLEKESREIAENIAVTKYAIEDFEYKKDSIQRLVHTIALRMEAMESNEEETGIRVSDREKSGPDNETLKEQIRISLYAERLKQRLNELTNEKDVCDTEIDETLLYLQSDHGIYEFIKEYSFGIHREFIDNEEKRIEAHGKHSKYIYFDFENNEYYADALYLMKECYVGEADNLHICKENGIYVDYIPYAASSLFLSGKQRIESDSNFIRAFEKIIDNDLDVCESSSGFSLFCMLPEAIDVFNTKIRRCLNTSKGKIISIPKSIAVTYYALNELSVGDRFCVINLDGLHPVITKLYIGKDDNDKKVILREGVISKHTIKYDYITFALEYIQEYQDKYSVLFTENEINRLIYAKALNLVFTKHEAIKLFRVRERIDVIFDESIFNSCFKKFVTKDYSLADCVKVYVVSSIANLVTGKNIADINSSVCYEGLSAIRNKLLDDANAVIWKEKLPKISLEVIDDNTGRFSTINLINENNEGQNIRLSLDREVELPFKGTITLQKGKKEYYLPLEREIFSEDINSAKEAYFYDKSLPLNKDVPVELVVKYNYLSESPIKLYARPKVKIAAFSELANTWVDPHEMKAYSGAVYEGHPKEMVQPKDYVFETTIIGLNKFIKGQADLSLRKFAKELRGQYEYHKDFKALNSSYFQLRSTFDPYNVSSDFFIHMYQGYGLSNVFMLANQALKCNDGFYGESSRSAVGKYKLSIANLFSNFVVASWYYDKSDVNIKQVYAYLVKESDIRILAKLSRCIQCEKDDIYDVFEKLSTKLKDYFKDKYKRDKLGDQRLSYIRTLSQNCWFTNTWMKQFYDTKNGPEAIKLITGSILGYLHDETFRSDKEYRDIMEFLVCLTMSRNYDDSMFNPNKEETRNLLYEIKRSYEEALMRIKDESLVSRLEMKQNQGALYGYHNYIYMLIVILSGEGQINLVGYHDE